LLDCKFRENLGEVKRVIYRFKAGNELYTSVSLFFDQNQIFLEIPSRQNGVFGQKIKIKPGIKEIWVARITKLNAAKLQRRKNEVKTGKTGIKHAMQSVLDI
jgi:hypothetical protein